VAAPGIDFAAIPSATGAEFGDLLTREIVKKTLSWHESVRSAGESRREAPCRL
jgi:hypothetical protein